MRSSLLLTAAAIAAATLMAALPAEAKTDTAKAATRSLAEQATQLRRGIQYHRAKTWWFQDKAGVPRTRSVHAERHTRSVPFLNWIDRLWMQRQHAAAHLVRRVSYRPAAAGFPPHHALWLCIHSIEAGSWYDHDSGGSGHYGGLQMHYNWGYGIAGDAGNYSQTEQEWAAERAYRASGYSSSFIYGQWLEWEHGAGNKCVSLE